MPVHDLDVAKEFYGNVLGCAEGRSSEKWQDYSLHGHQIVCHVSYAKLKMTHCIEHVQPPLIFFLFCNESVVSGLEMITDA